MKFGITIPNNFGVADVNQVLAFGPLAEELGYDSIWVMDHLFNAGYIRQRLDDKPYYHPLATLSYLSATTERVALGTSVLVLPYHNPIALAKYVATLDQMSNGRVILGVGVGAMTEEFEALGISMRQRGAITNESIAVMKELWTSEDPEFDSQRWHFAELKFAPKTKQSPHVPLWIGGSSSGAMKRTAMIGDGWHPTGMSPEDFRIASQSVRQMAIDAGRSSDVVTMSIRVEVEAHGGASSDRAQNRARLPGHDASLIVDGIRAYQDAGVEHIVLALNTGDVARITELMKIIAREVIPRFR